MNVEINRLLHLYFPKHKDSSPEPLARNVQVTNPYHKTYFGKPGRPLDVSLEAHISIMNCNVSDAAYLKVVNDRKIIWVSK